METKKQIQNLEDVIYEIRSEIGGLKDVALAKAGKKKYIGEGGSLKDVLGEVFVNETLLRINNYLGEINKDALIIKETPQNKEEINTRIKEIRHLSIELPEIKEYENLVNFSDKAKNFYDFMTPFVRKARNLDHLTGLPNLNSFNSSLKDEISRHIKMKEDFCLAMIDLDNFKKYNDTVGHEQADIVIKCIADNMEKNIGGVICRRSGDEFFILLPNSNIDNAKNVIGRELFNYIDKDLEKCVKDKLDYLGISYFDNFKKNNGKISASVGITSTNLLNESINVYHRLYKSLKENKHEQILNIKSKLEEGINKKYEGYSIYKELTIEERSSFKEMMSKMFLIESEVAMHESKKKDGNFITIFNPKKASSYCTIE